MIPICNLTLKELQVIPFLHQNVEIAKFTSLIILPTEDIHDSGYRAMSFIPARQGHPICQISGFSDVLHINGISGYGHRITRNIPLAIPPIGWSIDCLPVSGLLQLFASGHTLTIDEPLSSFSIYAIKIQDN